MIEGSRRVGGFCAKSADRKGVGSRRGLPKVTCDNTITDKRAENRGRGDGAFGFRITGTPGLKTKSKI